MRAPRDAQAVNMQLLLSSWSRGLFSGKPAEKLSLSVCSLSPGWSITQPFALETCLFLISCYERYISGCFFWQIFHDLLNKVCLFWKLDPSRLPSNLFFLFFFHIYWWYSFSGLFELSLVTYKIVYNKLFFFFFRMKWDNFLKQVNLQILKKFGIFIVLSIVKSEGKERQENLRKEAILYEEGIGSKLCTVCLGKQLQSNQ